jgi:hypothetical protein
VIAVLPAIGSGSYSMMEVGSAYEPLSSFQSPSQPWARSRTSSPPLLFGSPVAACQRLYRRGSPVIQRHAPSGSRKLSALLS